MFKQELQDSGWFALHIRQSNIILKFFTSSQAMIAPHWTALTYASAQFLVLFHSWFSSNIETKLMNLASNFGSPTKMVVLHLSFIDSEISIISFVFLFSVFGLKGKGREGGNFPPEDHD